MSKHFNNLLKYLIVFILLFSLTINDVNAGRGCCSWHGGQAYCDRSVGRWVCNDGTYSPSCTCEKTIKKTKKKTTKKKTTTKKANKKSTTTKKTVTKTSNTKYEEITTKDIKITSSNEKNDDSSSSLTGVALLYITCIGIFVIIVKKRK